jgi:Ca-activated chloride channel family protein
VIPDPSLDAQLRDIPEPADLAQRIKARLAPLVQDDVALEGSDDWLDARLRQVAVPETLAIRLGEIPSDEWLDEQLARVPAPIELPSNLRLVTPRERLGRVARWLAHSAVAATLFVAISAVLGGGIVGFIAADFARPDTSSDLVVMYDGPLSLDGQFTEEPAPSVVYVSSQADGFDEPPSNSHAARFASLSIDDPPAGRDPAPREVESWSQLVHAGLQPLDDAVLLRYGLLGSPQYTDDRLPELDAPLRPRAAGIEPPLVRGYNREFFQKHRIFPPISPARHPQLASVAVPLVTESDVLVHLERSLAQGRSVPTNELRVEDFLAAMNYRLAPASAGGVALRTAGGPAPFAPSGANLLQVSVQTGQLADRSQPATHLVLAIDLSQSMRWLGRLQMVQEAIDRLLDQLGPSDRLSLVLFNEQVLHRVELATAVDAQAIRSLLASLQPRGGTNLAAGLQQAASLAMLDSAEGSLARRLVLITDSQPYLSPAMHDRVRSLLVDARAAGVRLDVLDLSDSAQTNSGEVDPVLLDWAQNLDGDARGIQSTGELARSLTEALAGDSPVIASDAKLTLHFDPQTVAAYRLVGHAANPLADAMPVAIEAELAAGESATALVELWFRDDAKGSDRDSLPSDEVGRAELTWRDADGQPRRVTQRISRLQFAPTLAESPLSLQQAAIAAEVGQVLLGTRDALREVNQRPVNSRGLAGVLEVAARVHPQVRQRPDFQKLVDLTERIEKLPDR